MTAACTRSRRAAGGTLGGEQTVLKVGIVAMYVAVAFTFAAVLVIVALRSEPTRALASERAVLAAEEGPAHPTHLPKSLPGPERPNFEPEPVRQEAEPSQPTPARGPRPQPEPQTQPGPRSEPPSEPKPEPEPEQRAKAEPQAQLQARPKPEPERAPKPKSKLKPEQEPNRAAGRSSEPGPMRETVQRAESQRSERRAEPERLRSRPPAEKPRRSVLPAGVTMALSISALDLRDVPVRTSASERALDNGVIHLPDTSLPWDDGAEGRNVYLVGHRLGYPGTGSHRIFYRLRELRKGDEIVVKDHLGRRYQYRVTGSRVVAPSDSWVKDRVPGRDMLSLQTCTPIPTFERRLIVRANHL